MLTPGVIVAPLADSVPGNITNDLAVRMLFRPRKAIDIGEYHVLFMPLLIPGQQRSHCPAHLRRQQLELYEELLR